MAHFAFHASCSAVRCSAICETWLDEIDSPHATRQNAGNLLHFCAYLEASGLHHRFLCHWSLIGCDARSSHSLVSSRSDSMYSFCTPTCSSMDAAAENALEIMGTNDVLCSTALLDEDFNPDT